MSDAEIEVDLDDLKHKITQAIHFFDDKTPYSREYINMLLSLVEEYFGEEVAETTIYELRLHKMGWDPIDT